jgi:hypothetical protein
VIREALKTLTLHALAPKFKLEVLAYLQTESVFGYNVIRQYKGVCPKSLGK